MPKNTSSFSEKLERQELSNENKHKELENKNVSPKAHIAITLCACAHERVKKYETANVLQTGHARKGEMYYKT